MSPFPAIAAWFAILLLAIANGGLREALLIPRFDLRVGTTASGILLIIAVFAVASALVILRTPRNNSQTWLVGAGWLLATLVFEFSFGRIVQGKAWSELFAAYTFKNGNIWPLVLVAVFCATYLCQQIFTHRGSQS
jgi:hypothetical protein